MDPQSHPPAPTQPAPARKQNPLAVILGVGALLVFYYLFLRSPSPTTSPSTRTAPPVRTTAPTRAVLNESFPGTFRGTSEQQTTAFQLAGGDYRVDWSATYSGEYPDVGCFFGASMDRADEYGYESLASEDVTGRSPHSGTANLYNVDAGRWYFTVNSHCSWTLTIHR